MVPSVFNMAKKTYSSRVGKITQIILAETSPKTQLSADNSGGKFQSKGLTFMKGLSGQKNQGLVMESVGQPSLQVAQPLSP